MDSRNPNCERQTKDFLVLFQQHERQIYGYILSLVPNIASADDISQNTSLRLWERFDQFDPNKDFGAWARARRSASWAVVISVSRTIPKLVK